MANKKIIILDDHTLFLKGMRLILKECYTSCDVHVYQSIKALKQDHLNFDTFDLLISDIELPNEDTFGLFEELKQNYPHLPILVVSMHKKHSVIKKCKALNIEGYLLKDEDEQLTKAIEVILEGKEYYSERVVEFCNQTQNTFNKLSFREEEIIKLIANGFNNNEIAEKLFLSAETIKTHKRNIRTKLGIHNTHEIIEYAKKNFI